MRIKNEGGDRNIFNELSNANDSLWVRCITIIENSFIQTVQ